METVAENILKSFSIEEYFTMEEQSLERLEYYNGKIVVMPGGKWKHNLIAANCIAALNIALDEKQSGCLVLTSDMKIFVPQTVAFVYPDAVVVCEEPELYKGREDIILNPLLVIEVLSPSTESYDRTTKFYYYKQVPSFKEYVLIEQNKPIITASFKIAESTWKDTIAEGTEASIHLQSIDCTITLSKIYKGVQF